MLWGFRFSRCVRVLAERWPVRKRRKRAALQNLAEYWGVQTDAPASWSAEQSSALWGDRIFCVARIRPRASPFFTWTMRAAAPGRMPRLTDWPRPAHISLRPPRSGKRTTFAWEIGCESSIADYSDWRANLDGSSRLGRFSPIITTSLVILPHANLPQKASQSCFQRSIPKAQAGLIGWTERRADKSGTITGIPVSHTKSPIWRG